MLDSTNLPDKTFAPQFVFLLFQVIIQSPVNSAVGYKSTKLSKCGKNFLQDFFIILHSAKFMLSCGFHSRCVFLKTLRLKS